MVEQHHLVVEIEGHRLDSFLALRYPHLTRTQVQRLIGRGFVRVNQQGVKASYKVRIGDAINLTIAHSREDAPLVPQNIPLKIVYQDKTILVLDKPSGLTVHPGPGHASHTMVNAVLALCPNLHRGHNLRPGIVHRLDKDTSGLIVVGKTEEAQVMLAQQWKNRKVLKGYIALVKGRPNPPEGIIDAPIARHPKHRKRMAIVEGGRVAVTHYQTIRSVGNYGLLEVFPETGRTHQIRVHMASLGHPLIGDQLYGKRSPTLGRHFLHAHRLGFQLPATREYQEFNCSLPDELTRLLDKLEQENATP